MRWHLSFGEAKSNLPPPSLKIKVLVFVHLLPAFILLEMISFCILFYFAGVGQRAKLMASNEDLPFELIFNPFNARDSKLTDTERLKVPSFSFLGGFIFSTDRLKRGGSCWRRGSSSVAGSIS
jgi:hypothetical protein